MFKPVVLVVLDGWGIGKNKKGNAITEANLPTIDKLNNFYPHIALQASGISVGLPWGEPGNSEVGHITLGTGRIIYQNLPRITMEIQNGEFFKHQSFLKAVANVQKNNSNLHLIGLVGKGSVHSNMDHLYALLELAKQQKVEKVFIHAFTDGRDSAPNSGIESLRELQKKIAEYGIGKIATLCGRYFAMDRNNNWDRIEKAYELLTKGEGIKISDPIKYLEESYAKEIFDEYIEPAVVIENEKPATVISENDSVIFFNFREDRARQLTKAFVLPGFMKFERPLIKNLDFVTMIQYEEGLPVSIAFHPIEIKNCIGNIISKKSLFQLRIAETEKFAHVTYFFNGGIEEAFPKENRIIVPSLTVESFDKAPGMSANKITDEILSALEKDKYNFILVNYANADIVGHTGNEAATIQAVETIDQCLSRLIPATIAKGGCLLITADHGNAEEIKNKLTGEINTEHSANPVPLWFITSENHSDAHRKSNAEGEANGLLSDVAPTVLELLNMKKSEDMTGESLLPLLK